MLLGGISAATLVDTAALAAVDEIVVRAGSRRPVGSLSDIPSPVTVVSVDQITNQGSTNMSELLRTVVPSFNVSEQPISGTATTSRPANLRGLSADHTLVLVNGKRRHRSADIPTFGTALIIGSQGPDLASIPTIALSQVEVLRDGAAAQYGADAVAGVINFKLNDSTDTAKAEIKYGGYSEGDGEQWTISGSYGLGLGDKGFLVLSGEYSESDPTNRAREANLGSIQALVDAGNTAAASQNVVWGAPEINDNIKLFANFGYDIADSAELYGFASYAERETIGGFFYRNVNDRDGIFTSGGNRLVGDLTPGVTPCLGHVDHPGGVVTADGGVADQAVIAAAAGDPECFTWANVFPGGYAPLFGSELEDQAVNIGVRGETGGGWKWDVSAGYGSNELTFNISNVTSPSFGGPGAPTSFDDLGSRKQEEIVVNIDLSKEFDVGFHSPLNVAFGYQWHEEEWTVGLGQLESYAQGPLFSQGFQSGTDGYYGYGPASVGSFDRDNNAFYVDLEADVTEKLVLGAAVRYEDFSDLGSETTWKVSGLYRLTDSFSIRGTAATGYHAPTPAQQNFVYAVTEGDGAGNLTESGVIPPDNSVAASFGAKPMEPETSESFTIGFAYDSDAFNVTLDIYQIKVDDRISLSSSFPITAAQRMELAASGFVGVDAFQTIQFFTNDFDTKTTGADLIATMPLTLGNMGGSTNLSFSANYNKTEVESRSSLTSDSQVFSLEEGLPKFRGSLTLDHATDTWRALARINHYSDSTSRLFGCCDLEAGSATTVDLEAGYSVTENIELVLGGQNIFDKTPKDVSNEGISGAVGTRYAPEAPWGFNGSFWYGKVRFSF